MQTFFAEEPYLQRRKKVYPFSGEADTTTVLRTDVGERKVGLRPEILREEEGSLPLPWKELFLCNLNCPRNTIVISMANSNGLFDCHCILSKTLQLRNRVGLERLHCNFVFIGGSWMVSAPSTACNVFVFFVIYFRRTNPKNKRHWPLGSDNVSTGSCISTFISLFFAGRSFLLRSLSLQCLQIYQKRRSPSTPQDLMTKISNQDIVITKGIMFLPLFAFLSKICHPFQVSSLVFSCIHTHCEEEIE